MGALWELIGGGLGGLIPWLVGALGAVGLYVVGRFNGAAKAKAKQAEGTLKGIQRGAQGAADAEADLRAGKTPEQIVRQNDDDWR